jgi:polysaccharide biosynthesis/export protein
MRMPKYVILACCLTSAAFAQKESMLIGPGDEIEVQVYDTPDLNQTARITDGGEFPLILGGTVKLASLTPSQAARTIEAALVKGEVMYYPKVLVTVTQYATQSVTVFGQVAKPGSYEIDTPRSVVDVLGLAGGLTDIADRHITIERHTSHRQISYYVANKADDLLDQKIMVNPGDKVIVPKTGFVYVLGDVNRPGGYSMNNNDGSLSILQAISQAGGTPGSAVPNGTRLIRRTAIGGYQSETIPFSAMQKGKKPDIPLQAGDIVYVPFSYLRNAALSITSIAASTAGAALYISK